MDRKTFGSWSGYMDLVLTLRQIFSSPAVPLSQFIKYIFFWSWLGQKIRNNFFSFYLMLIVVSFQNFNAPLDSF